MSGETCPNSGLDRDDCPCLSCRPLRFNFKYTLYVKHGDDYPEINSIDDVIHALRVQKAYFERLKREGFTLSEPVHDSYAEFDAPVHDKFYWVECASSGCLFKVDVGQAPPRKCPVCGKNAYDNTPL